MTLEIRTAIERTARRDARQSIVLHEVWQQFLDHGGPVAVADVERGVGSGSPEDVRAALAALDEADLLMIENDAIQLAYPFSAGPNAFEIEVAGATRYTCCAIDALGMAAMLDATVTIRGRCHHCDEPIVIDTDPAGPRSLPEAMVWVAPRDACAPRVASGL